MLTKDVFGVRGFCRGHPGDHRGVIIQLTLVVEDGFLSKKELIGYAKKAGPGD